MTTVRKGQIWKSNSRPDLLLILEVTGEYLLYVDWENRYNITKENSYMTRVSLLTENYKLFQQ